MDRDTASGWLDAWQEHGLDCLADAPKPGRRRKIDGSLEALLCDILIENTSPNLGFTFRRARRVTAKLPCSKRQERVQRALFRLHRLEDAGHWQVLHGDERGFCLSSVVPYLWQPKGRALGLPAKSHSRRLNVLGFLSRADCLHTFQAQGKITALS